jgi:hypothetical protein
MARIKHKVYKLYKNNLNCKKHVLRHSQLANAIKMKSTGQDMRNAYKILVGKPERDH